MTTAVDAFAVIGFASCVFTFLLAVEALVVWVKDGLGRRRTERAVRKARAEWTRWEHEMNCSDPTCPVRLLNEDAS